MYQIDTYLKTKIDETTEMDKSMVTVTDFNTPLLRSTRPEKTAGCR